MRKKIIEIFFVLFNCGLIVSCSSNPYYEEQVDKHLYTKASLNYERGRYSTTNYRVGILLPINSEVTVVEMNRKIVIVEVTKTGDRIEIVNNPKHTKQRIEDAYQRILGDKITDLSDFSKMERKNIEAGIIEKGMSKKAVLLAFGYPPAIATPDITSDNWTYWKTRYNKMLVTFSDGKLSAIKN